MITYSGIQVEAIGMKCQGTPTPLDIAVHAGRICRFGGAIWMPLLPHLVLVGLLAYKRSSSVANLLWGFLHDAHETITCDVPKPFKCDCMRQEQAAIDKRLFDLYHGDLNSEVHHSMIDFDLIKECDLIACDLEAVILNLPGYAELIHQCHRSNCLTFVCFRTSNTVRFIRTQFAALIRRAFVCLPPRLSLR
ncbi:MAG: hypothetical protein IPN69_08050 [Acidobacteria bacterium]|nr:hypothetical protein [Acidobacteriota bacterium]